MPPPRIPSLRAAAGASYRSRLPRTLEVPTLRSQSTSTSSSIASDSAKDPPPPSSEIFKRLAPLTTEQSLHTSPRTVTLTSPAYGRRFNLSSATRNTASSAGQSSSSGLRPYLKSNPYVGSYTVTEADLGEDVAGHLNNKSPSLSSSSSTPSEGPAKRQRHGLYASFKTTSSSPTKALHTFISDHGETVNIYSSYLTFQGQGWDHPTVVTFTRLRDACTCKYCRHMSTRQKTFSTSEAWREAHLPRAPSFELSVDPRRGDSGLSITWPLPRGARDVEGDRVGDRRHKSFLPWWKLKILSNPTSYDRLYQTPSFSRKVWDADNVMKSDDLFIPYSELLPSGNLSSEVMARLLTQLQVYGLVFLRGVPTDPTTNEACMLRKVANLMGEIRNTFYGETWDVKSVKKSKNVAYTDLDLGLHMDLLYFSSPPRFQLLHCLRNRVKGGLSYFVDSFSVARDLKHDLPSTFRLLQENRLTYIYDNDNHFLRYRHPVIDPNFSFTDPHSAINWSPPFRGQGETLATKGSRDVDKEVKNEEAFYEALHEFETRLSSPQYRYEYQMQEGDMVLFDNRRVLHARTAFRDKTEEERVAEAITLVEGEPTRWLKGCYLDGEVVWDKLAVLRKGARTQGKVTSDDLEGSE